MTSRSQQITLAGAKAALTSALLASVGACSSEPGAFDDLNALPPTLTIISSTPASGSIDAADVFALAPSRITWSVVERDGSPPASAITFDVVTDTTSDHGAEIRLDESPKQSFFLRRDAGGGVVMTATESHDDKAITLFEPPLGMAPAKEAAATAFESKASMQVLTMASPPAERDKGNGRRTVRVATDDVIRTPLGELHCMRVDVEFVADLQYAKATVRSQTWILPGTGPVAERSIEKIVVLGLIPRQQRQTSVRITPAGESKKMDPANPTSTPAGAGATAAANSP